jgi:hypothetical protein
MDQAFHPKDGSRAFAVVISLANAFANTAAVQMATDWSTAQSAVLGGSITGILAMWLYTRHNAERGALERFNEQTKTLAFGGAVAALAVGTAVNLSARIPTDKTVATFQVPEITIKQELELGEAPVPYGAVLMRSHNDDKTEFLHVLPGTTGDENDPQARLQVFRTSDETPLRLVSSDRPADSYYSLFDANVQPTQEAIDAVHTQRDLAAASHNSAVKASDGYTLLSFASAANKDVGAQ